MLSLFRLVIVGIVVGAGAYIYMRQAQSASAGNDNPAETVDLVGVRHDLMAIVRGERVHNALHNTYGSIDELRSSGDLSMERNSRGPYNYSVEINGPEFRVIATYVGPPAGVPKIISVDQAMHFSQQ